jgi:allantoin racemase
VKIANITGPGNGVRLVPPVISPGVEVVSIERSFGVHPGNFADLLLLEAATVEAVMRAEEEGCDAAFINTVLDYGLVPARSAVRIPVVGAGQASMLSASALGHHFGIVSIWPESTRHLHEAQLRDYGLTDRCASMRFVTHEREMSDTENGENIFERIVGARADVVERTAAEIAAVVGGSADVVILGCTCMSHAAAQLAENAGVPVIDPLATGWAFTEMIAGLGLHQSAAAFVPVIGERRRVFQDLTVAAGDALVRTGEDLDECEGACVIPQPAESRSHAG